MRLLWVGQRGEDAEAIAGAGQLGGIVCCDWSPSLARLSTRVPIVSIERTARIRRRWSSSDLSEIPADTFGKLVRSERQHGRVGIVPYKALSQLLSASPVDDGVVVAAPSPSLVDELDDKVHQRRLFAEWGVPTPRSCAMSSADWRRSCNDHLPLRFPLVAQRRRGSLGRETVRLNDAEAFTELARRWSPDEELLFSEYHPGLVVNVTVAIAANGAWRLAWPSIQVTGAAACGADSEFLYCGNDFSAAQRLPALVLEEIFAQVSLVAARAAGRSYRGVLGIDMVWNGRSVMTIEINPRFQGSTACLTACELNAGVRPTVELGLADWLAPEGALLEVTAGEPRQLAGAELVLYAEAQGTAFEVDGLPDAITAARCFAVPGTRVEKGAMVGRLRFSSRVLNDAGDRLANDVARIAEVIRGKAQRT